MTRLALCVGINAYAQSPLRGCVNDAQDWAAALEERGYEVVTLLDGQASRDGLIAALRALTAGSRRGDRLVFTFSGHGTYVPDLDGDEADGRDEALVTADMQLITDDVLLPALTTRARMTVISDSCHSGTVSRFAGNVDRALGQPRFLDPAAIGVTPMPGRSRQAPSRGNALLLSGCADHEVSYDADIDGRFRGAMTAAALQALPTATSWRDWHQQTLRLIKHPQTPQLSARPWQRLYRPLD